MLNFINLSRYQFKIKSIFYFSIKVSCTFSEVILPSLISGSFFDKNHKMKKQDQYTSSTLITTLVLILIFIRYLQPQSQNKFKHLRL